MNTFFNNIQFFILLFILGGSFSTWLFGKLREKRELKVMRDAERRRKEELLRTGRASEVPAAQGAPSGGARDSEAMRALAEKRQAQIRALRERKGGQQQTGTLGGPPRATPIGMPAGTRSTTGTAGRSSGGGSGGSSGGGSVAARNMELARRREEMLRAIRERQGEPKKAAVSRPQESAAADRVSEARPASKSERSRFSPGEKAAAPVETPRPVVAIEAEAAPRRTYASLMPAALPSAPSTSVLVRRLLKPKPGERADRMTLGAIFAATEILGKPVSLRDQQPGG